MSVLEVLSGTPQQIFNLIPDAENGLFSRFVFYAMPTELVWHDMFAFTHADFCEVAQSLGITTKTAERYITELCKNGQLEHPAHGQYYKPDKNR